MGRWKPACLLRQAGTDGWLGHPWVGGGWWSASRFGDSNNPVGGWWLGGGWMVDGGWMGGWVGWVVRVRPNNQCRGWVGNGSRSRAAASVRERDEAAPSRRPSRRAGCRFWARMPVLGSVGVFGRCRECAGRATERPSARRSGGAGAAPVALQWRGNTGARRGSAVASHIHWPKHPLRTLILCIYKLPRLVSKDGGPRLYARMGAPPSVAANKFHLQVAPGNKW